MGKYYPQNALHPEDSCVVYFGREAPWSSGFSSSAMVQKVAVSPEFEARLRHAATGKLSLSTQQKMGTFFELGKDKAAKGEGWAPPFISCAQDTVGL